MFVENSSFHVKSCTTGKVQLLFFRSFLLVLAKLSFWEKGLTLGFNCMKFWRIWYFLNPKIVWEFVRELLYAMFIINNDASFHLLWKENLAKHQNVSKYCDRDYLKKFHFLFMSLPTASFIKNCHILTGTHFIFLIKSPRTNLKAF